MSIKISPLYFTHVFKSSKNYQRNNGFIISRDCFVLCKQSGRMSSDWILYSYQFVARQSDVAKTRQCTAENIWHTFRVFFLLIVSDLMKISSTPLHGTWCQYKLSSTALKTIKQRVLSHVQKWNTVLSCAEMRFTAVELVQKYYTDDFIFTQYYS